MMSNIKKICQKFSTVTVTSDCGYKTFMRLDRGGVYHWINVFPNGKFDDSSFLEKALRNASGIIFELNKAEDLLEELEDEAFWLCTARAEKQKGIEMW